MSMKPGATMRPRASMDPRGLAAEIVPHRGDAIALDGDVGGGGGGAAAVDDGAVLDQE